MVVIKGFFSYAHADDYRNRLQELREDLCAEYRIITGCKLSLFIDRVGLTWGKEWNEELKVSLDKSSFFVPVLSPSYFRSEYCQKELIQFLSKAERQRGQRLILPILYAVNPADRFIDDPLSAKVLKYQYEDWTELRLASRDSSRYRAAINRMAIRLAKASAALEESSENYLQDDTAMDTHDSGPDSPEGSHSIDVASFDGPVSAASKTHHENTQRVIGLLTQIAIHNSDIGRLSSEFTPRIVEAMVSGVRDTNLPEILHEFAAELSPVALAYDEASQALFNATFCMDQSVRALVDAQVLDAVIFDESMSELSSAAMDARNQLESCRTTVRDIEQQSRILYNPMSTIDHAITRCLAAIDVMLDWRELRTIDVSEVDSDA